MKIKPQMNTDKHSEKFARPGFPAQNFSRQIVYRCSSVFICGSNKKPKFLQDV
ncbi:MAG: hypothetical protein KME40_08435 [Komarekiella atlantica HA4396-MV6]|nr:hypothetical protein [Komarekiella atlantica HA4396-MV6]